MKRKITQFAIAILLALSLGVTSSTYAQRVSLDLGEVTIQDAIVALQQSGGYSVSINSSDVDMSRKVSVSVQDADIQGVVEQIFMGQDVEYDIDGKIITVRQASKVAVSYQGVVYDEYRVPIIGATVVIVDSSIGTATNTEGKFSLSTTQRNPTIRVSYIGYEDSSVTMNSSKTFVEVELLSSATKIDDVVVVGYGVQSKRDVSTAISQVSSEDISNLPTADFRQALIGKMPGVTVMQPSGDPEGSVTVRIRGVSSITAGNDPLYVIDGVPVESGLSNINQNDIESVEVLKDASSAAIYGSRGSNGVVLITTKTGRSGKTTVSYDGYVSFDSVSKKIDMMDAYEFAEIAVEAHDNAYYDIYPGGTAANGDRPESYMNYPVELIPYINGVEGLTDTDWQDEIFRSAISTSHNVSIAGEGANTSYFISGNYLKKEGIIINSDYEKYSARLNLQGKNNRLSYGVNFAPSYSKSNSVPADGVYTSGGIVQSALCYSPTWPVYNEDGSYNYDGNGYWRIGTDYQHNEILNPVAVAYLDKSVIYRMAMVGRAFVGYDIIDGLKFTTSLGGSYYGAHNDQYRAKELPYRGKAYYDSESDGEAYSSSGFTFNWLWENQLTYHKEIGDDHKFDAVLVQSAQMNTYKGNNVTSTSFPNDYLETIAAGTVSDGNSSTTQWSLASYLARLQYSFKSKYMFSAAIRADGSSRFGANNRWGYFPSASAAWRISAEPFMQDNPSLEWVTDIKLRASYGQTGNFDIGNYEHLATLASDDYTLGSGSGSLSYGYAPSNVDNPDLTWEKNSMTNVGIDVNLWRGLLSVTAEYYYCNTTDMLLDVPVSHLAGYSNSLMNIGKVNNRGFEFMVSSTRRFQNGMRYNFNASIAKNINEVLALGDNDTPIIETSGTDYTYFLTTVGEAIGSYYLLVQDGIFSSQAELDAYPHFDSTVPGDLKFVDVNGDGVMDVDEDRAVVGNYMPEFTYNFGGSVGYKNFDLEAQFQGVYGNEIINLSSRYIDNMEGNTNGTTLALDRWKSEEDPGTGEVNRANRKSTGYNGRTSTWHVEDGSYLRLQTLSLGYTLPKFITAKLSIEKARIYVSGYNLFTLTKYRGYNPEVSLYSSALTQGVDYGTYPLARTYMIGANISF